MEPARDEETGRRQTGNAARYPGTPRWVKVCGLLTLAFVVVFAAVHLAGGGFRHHGAVGDHHAPAAAGARSAETGR